mmetsp:Transcript_39986/g.78821  ORF Transcript_39986/g.78821 Transcript_39986/m.78821 type:complete len:309 (+) Transcript_39986:1184-2110(+)
MAQVRLSVPEGGTGSSDVNRDEGVSVSKQRLCHVPGHLIPCPSRGLSEDGKEPEEPVEGQRPSVSSEVKEGGDLLDLCSGLLGEFHGRRLGSPLSDQGRMGGCGFCGEVDVDGNFGAVSHRHVDRMPRGKQGRHVSDLTAQALEVDPVEVPCCSRRVSPCCQNDTPKEEEDTPKRSKDETGDPIAPRQSPTEMHTQSVPIKKQRPDKHARMDIGLPCEPIRRHSLYSRLRAPRVGKESRPHCQSHYDCTEKALKLGLGILSQAENTEEIQKGKDVKKVNGDGTGTPEIFRNFRKGSTCKERSKGPVSL